jgi:RNA polymerase sigma factor FliA
VKNRRLFDPKNPDHVLVVEALPTALAAAHARCRAYRVRDSELIGDAEQRACEALYEGLPGYDRSRAPYPIYVYKRVYFAVGRYLKHEISVRQEGLEAALDAAEELRDTSDPRDDDEEAKDQLKAYLRYMAFRRFLGDARGMLRESPDDALVRARVWQALEKALGRLDEREKRFIELRYWGDQSYAQIAAELGVHEKYAQRLDERLRERLNRDLR